MEENKLGIYVELPEEVQQIFAENETSINQILRDNSIDVEVRQDVAPYKEEDGATSKDLVTLIFAGSTALASITHAITSIMNTLYKKPYWIEYDELVEIRGKDGNVLLNKKGKPIFKTVKKFELVEPRKENKSYSFESMFSAVKGIVLKVKNEEKEITDEQEEK